MTQTATAYFNNVIIKEQQLFIQYFKGNLDLETSIEAKRKQLTKNFYKLPYCSIIDFRDATLCFTDDDIKSFIQFLENQQMLNPRNRSALLTNSPNQLVWLQIFLDTSAGRTSNYKIVSTLHGALKWIGMPDIHDEVYGYIEHLRNTR